MGRKFEKINCNIFCKWDMCINFGQNNHIYIMKQMFNTYMKHVVIIDSYAIVCSIATSFTSTHPTHEFGYIFGILTSTNLLLNISTTIKFYFFPNVIFHEMSHTYVKQWTFKKCLSHLELVQNKVIVGSRKSLPFYSKQCKKYIGCNLLK
jgi:hypothetical protein